jgi:hypothetical protein
LKNNKTKKNKGEVKFPFCQDLVMAPTYAQKKKKPKKGKRGGVQAPFLLRLGHGALKATKQMKKGGEQVPLLPRVGDGIAKSTKKKLKKHELSPPSIKTWRWHPITSRKKEKKRSKLPLC